MALLPTNENDEEVFMETRVASPANFLIKIESFSLLSKYGVRKYESREFEAGDYKWRLVIYPDGDQTERAHGDYVSVHLSAAGTTSLPMDWEVNAIFTIFLYNQISDNYLCFRGKTRRFQAMTPKWGFSKLISKKILTDPSNGYLVDDNCVFGAEVFVIQTQRVIECVSVLKVSNSCKREWRIPCFSNLKDVWTSEEFPSGSHRWKIKLYRNGNGSEQGRSGSICLESVDSKSFDPHEKVKAEFCITIQTSGCGPPNRSVNSSHWFTSSDQSWELPDWMSIDEMHRFLQASYCYLQIEISVQVVAVDSDKPKKQSTIVRCSLIN